MKPMIILSAGLPGVGKTTHFSRLAEVMTAFFPCILINKDRITEELGQSYDPHSEYYLKIIGPYTYQFMVNKAKEHLLEGKIVLLDGYFGNKLTSSPIKDLFINPDIDVRIIYFHCTPKTQETRILARGSIRDADKKGNQFFPFRRAHLESHLIELAQTFFFSVNTECENMLDENISAILKYLQEPNNPKPIFKKIDYSLSAEESNYDELRFKQLIKARHLLVQFHEQSERWDKLCFWKNDKNDLWSAIGKGSEEKPCGPGYGF